MHGGGNLVFTGGRMEGLKNVSHGCATTDTLLMFGGGRVRSGSGIFETLGNHGAFGGGTVVLIGG